MAEVQTRTHRGGAAALAALGRRALWHVNRTPAFISAPPIFPGFSNGIVIDRPLEGLDRLVLRPWS